jgi:hypothetical protein
MNFEYDSWYKENCLEFFERDERYTETNSIGNVTKFGVIVGVRFVSNMTGSYECIIETQEKGRIVKSAMELCSPYWISQ